MVSMSMDPNIEDYGHKALLREQIKVYAIDMEAAQRPI